MIVYYVSGLMMWKNLFKLQHYKDTTRMDKLPREKFLYTEEQLIARLKFIIGIILAVTLMGIIFVVLYSIMFVPQPTEISPIDQKFFELIIPIATFLTGTLSGIMMAKGSRPDSDRVKEEDKPS